MMKREVSLGSICNSLCDLDQLFVSESFANLRNFSSEFLPGLDRLQAEDSADIARQPTLSGKIALPFLE